jgi:hypothetical protein
LTDKGKMFLILYQTFAFMQIFNILNSRRPSFKDINPFEGISILTVMVLIGLVTLQFTICYIPGMFGYNTISLWANCVCMGLGGASVAWFTASKAMMSFILGGEDLYPTQV